MLLASIVIFGVAALGGLVLAIQRFRGKLQPSLGLALVHGAAAATALVLLILVVAGAAAGTLSKAALGLFLVAALGGFFLFATHLQKKALPIPVVVLHALLAVAGFGALLAGFLTHA